MMKITARAALGAVRDSLRLAVQKVAENALDLGMLAGIGLLGWGIRLEYGESWALMAVGGLLLSLSVLASLRSEG